LGRNSFILIATGILFCFFLSNAQAQEVKPLPEFQVLLRGDSETRVSSLALSAEPQWLMVIMRPNCSDCRKLFSFFEDLAPELLQRVVLILQQDDQGKNEKLVAKYPNTFAAPWYTDPSETTVQALQLKGTPVVIGVKTGVMEWSLRGITPETETWQSILRTWIENRNQ
jgi:hypothetical protein